MSSKGKPRKLGIATTMQAASSDTGLSLDEIKAVQDSGSKAFKANGRIDKDLLLDDYAKLPDEKKKCNYHVEKALAMRAARKLKEQEYEKRAGDLLPKSEVKRDVFRNVIAFKTKVYDSENTIAVESGMKLSLQPDQIAQLREIIQKHLRLAIKELHEGKLGKIECPECKKEFK